MGHIIIELVAGVLIGIGATDVAHRISMRRKRKAAVREWDRSAELRRQVEAIRAAGVPIKGEVHDVDG